MRRTQAVTCILYACWMQAPQMLGQSRLSQVACLAAGPSCPRLSNAAHQHEAASLTVASKSQQYDLCSRHAPLSSELRLKASQLQPCCPFQTPLSAHMLTLSPAGYQAHPDLLYL